MKAEQRIERGLKELSAKLSAKDPIAPKRCGREPVTKPVGGHVARVLADIAARKRSRPSTEDHLQDARVE